MSKIQIVSAFIILAVIVGFELFKDNQVVSSHQQTTTTSSNQSTDTTFKKLLDTRTFDSPISTTEITRDLENAEFELNPEIAIHHGETASADIIKSNTTESEANHTGVYLSADAMAPENLSGNTIHIGEYMTTDADPSTPSDEIHIGEFIDINQDTSSD